MTGTNLVMTSTSPPRTLSLSRLLRRAVVGARGQKLGGQLSDVIVRLRDADYPLVTSLVAELDGPPVFVPTQMVTDWDTEQVSLSSARVDLRTFERHAGEVLLRSDILGHRLIDIPTRAWCAPMTPTRTCAQHTRPRPDTDHPEQLWPRQPTTARPHPRRRATWPSPAARSDQAPPLPAPHRPDHDTRPSMHVLVATLMLRHGHDADQVVPRHGGSAGRGGSDR